MNEVIKIAAFTIQGQGGNPAGVVLDAAALIDQDRQKIAARLGYSETAFVDRTKSGLLRLQFYTPNKQIDICGHATVASFAALRDRGIVSVGPISFESKIGLQSVEVLAKSIGLWQKRDFVRIVTDQQIVTGVAYALGLESNQISSPLQIASNGSPFLQVNTTDLKTLSQIEPNFDAILKLSQELGLIGFYVYSENDNYQIEARMFAPNYGIPEESATGMAAGALGLMRYEKGGTKSFQIIQGHLMPQPSAALLTVSVRNAESVLVSGETHELERIKL